jgi:hypothetical protein
LEKVNIADWLFNIPDAEYQRSSPAHIAAGHTTSDDGRPMSINVETIGEALMVQHFCRLTSISNAITMKGRTKVYLLWELSAKKRLMIVHVSTATISMLLQQTSS